MASLSFDAFFRKHRQQIEALFRSSGGTLWSVSPEDFARVVWEGIASAAQAEPRQIPELLKAVRPEDLGLALGCARGNEWAWNTFCAEYRSVLFKAAYALLREESRASDLVDSVLAELFGVDAGGAGRHSRFTYFHGRSSLKTWLGAVVFQKFVNEYRRESRLETLDDSRVQHAAVERSVSEPDDRRYAECLGEAVETALGDLLPREKLLLSYYYVQQLTLKQIGRLTGEHEATVSRHLESLRKKLRMRIETYLWKVKKLSAFEVDRCLDFATRGVSVDLARALKAE